jgi:hypothetical protein
MQSNLYSFQILMKLAFSQPVFEKYSSVTFHVHPSNECRAVPCGRTEGRSDVLTDRYDDANSSLSQFCQRGEKYQAAK